MSARTPKLCLTVAVVACGAWAQTPPPGNPNEWTAPPLPASPAAKPPPSPNDPLAFGFQFHGELAGGTAGFGGAASFGLGFNRVAILLTPALTMSGNTAFTTLGISFDASVRIYLRQRVAGALVGYLHPGAGFITNLVGSNVSVFGQLSFGGGAEYLLNRNLGFTVELSLRYSGVATGGALFGVNTIGTVGIMLHQ